MVCLCAQDAASVFNLRGLLAHRENKPAKAIVYLVNLMYEWGRVTLGGVSGEGCAIHACL